MDQGIKPMLIQTPVPVMKLTADQTLAADVDENCEIGVEDAQSILKYYTAKTVAQKDITWDDILNPAAKKA